MPVSVGTTKTLYDKKSLRCGSKFEQPVKSFSWVIVFEPNLNETPESRKSFKKKKNTLNPIKWESFWAYSTKRKEFIKNFRDSQTDQNRKNADQGRQKVINLSQNRTHRGPSSENHQNPTNPTTQKTPKQLTIQN